MTITAKSRHFASFPNASQNNKHSATGANTSAIKRKNAREWSTSSNGNTSVTIG